MGFGGPRTQISRQTPSCQWFPVAGCEAQKRPRLDFEAGPPYPFPSLTSGNHFCLGVWQRPCNQFTAFRIPSRKSQNFGTVSMWIFSSGEWTPSSVGPNETMSIPG